MSTGLRRASSDRISQSGGTPGTQSGRDDAWQRDRTASEPMSALKPRRSSLGGAAGTVTTPMSRAASGESIGDDFIVRVHDKGFTSNVKCIAFTAGGGSIAVGAIDGSLTMYSANDLNKVVHTFVGHTDACVAADFTVGGSKLVSGSWDGTVRIWETTSGDNSQTLIGHKGKVTSVAFSDTGEWLVSGGMDETVRIWATATGDPIDVLSEGVVHPITAVALSRGGEQLAEASNDFSVRVWDIKQDGSRTEHVLSRIRDDAKRLSEAEFESRESQKSRRASHSLRSSLRRNFFGQERSKSEEDTPSKKPEYHVQPMGCLSTKFTLTGHTATVSALAFHPGKPVLLTVSHDATARVHHAQTGAVMAWFASDSGKPIWACRFSSDGSILALGTGDGGVEVWASKDPTVAELLFSFQSHPSFVDSLAFSGDGLRLASGSATEVAVWKLKPAEWYVAREHKRRLVLKSDAGTSRASAAPTTPQSPARPSTDPLRRPSSAGSQRRAPSRLFASSQDGTTAEQQPRGRDPYAHMAAGATSDDVRHLLDLRTTAMEEEEAVVQALYVAVQQRQAEIEQLEAESADVAARRDRRTDLGLPAWGLVTQDTDYLEKLRARKRVLYQRVGRDTARGDTATTMDIAQLHPNDLERLARFEDMRQLGTTQGYSSALL
eukprot:m.176390 g.176390  ORF g.176390 m.176390 type:complete len:663 (-) comp14156_c0_seq1:134-2122(-)